MINNHKASIKLKAPFGEIINDDSYGDWEIQLKMQINFISFLDTGEIRTIDSKSDNVEVFILLMNF